MENNNILKTGTTTVGLVSKDSVVLAADKRATAGNFIAGKNVDKIINVTDFMALTTAGIVSDIQLLVKIIRAELALKRIRTGRRVSVKEASNLTAGLVYSNIRKLSMIPALVHFLFAGHDTQGDHLYDIYPDGSISEIEDFVASGSGSMFAYGVFESQYKKDIAQEEAVELALNAVNAALQRDSASGEGIDVFIINDKGAKQVMKKKINKVLN